jgi:hypothetical protein
MKTLLKVARNDIIIPLIKVDSCLIERLVDLGGTLLELDGTYLANMLIFEDLLEEDFINIVAVDVGHDQRKSVVKLENHFRSAGRET